jgi:hypothetical protein
MKNTHRNEWIMAKEAIDEPRCPAQENEKRKEEWHVLHAFCLDHQSLKRLFCLVDQYAELVQTNWNSYMNNFATREPMPYNAKYDRTYSIKKQNAWSKACIKKHTLLNVQYVHLCYW